MKDRRFENIPSTGGEEEKSPRCRNSAPVTPKMLIKALKRLRKSSFNTTVFSPPQVTSQILSMYPSVEQNTYALLLEVVDKLNCAAAAGLLGTVHHTTYYAFDARREGMEADTRSELMFWLYYKKLLKRKQDKRAEKEMKQKSHQLGRISDKGQKVVRLMSFTDDHLHFFPLIKYRKKLKQ